MLQIFLTKSYIVFLGMTSEQKSLAYIRKSNLKCKKSKLTFDSTWKHFHTVFFTVPLVGQVTILVTAHILHCRCISPVLEQCKQISTCNTTYGHK